MTMTAILSAMCVQPNGMPPTNSAKLGLKTVLHIGMPVKFAKNFDLLGQKTVTLADMLKEGSLEKAKIAAGEGWTEDRFYLTEEGNLILMKGSEGGQVFDWAAENVQPEWKSGYEPLFRKK